MRRRAFLATVGLAALSGCTGDSGGSPDATETESDEESGPDEQPIGAGKTQNGIEVTATDTTVARQVFGSDDFLARDGVYLLVRVEVRNAGDEPTEIPSVGAFSALDGSEQYEPIGAGGFEPSEITLESPVEGETYIGGREIHPDVTEEGWLIFEIPDEFGDLSLAYSYTEMFGEDAQTGYWALNVERNEAANLEGLSIDGPESVEWGETATFTFEAENVGNRTATFIYNAGFGNPDDIGGVDTERESIEIPPNDSMTKTFEIMVSEMEPLRFEFNSWEQDIEVTPATASFGEPITTPGGVEIEISRQRFEPFYRLEGQEDREFAEDGDIYSFAYIQAENTASGRRSIPDETVARGDDQTYSAVSRSPWTNTFVEPVSGPWSYTPRSLDAGETQGGWIIHKVSGGVTEDEIEIRLRTGDETVYAIWSR